MKPLASLLATTALAALSISAAPPPASAPEETTRAAPEARAPNTPSEAVLEAPPEDTERSVLPQGFVEVPNPAFPARPAAPVPPARGPRLGRQDVAPYFAEGKLKEAKDAFDRGQYGRARALLKDQGDAPPVRFLRALAALRDDQHAPAAAELSALANDYPALADRCQYHAATAYETLGDNARAAEQFARVPEGSRLWATARLGLARALRRQKDLAGAVAALQPLAQRPAGGSREQAEALLLLADLHAQRKAKDEERRALWQVWSGFPLSPLAQVADRRLKGQAPPVEARVARGEALIELHRNKDGLKLLEPLLPRLALPDALACRAHFAYGKALRKERQHTRALGVLAPVVDKCEGGELRARALYVLGSSRSIVDPDAGASTYEQLAHDYPEHTFADDALFYAADLYARNGEWDKAAARLDDVVRLYPRGDFLGEALFKRYWIARARGAPDRGLSVLDEVERRFARADESYDVERARYWRARTLEEGGDKARAAALFEQLADEHPATYYGLMARAKLGELDAERLARLEPRLRFEFAAADPWPLHAGRLASDPRFLAGVELLRLGFNEAVSTELLAVNRTDLPPEPTRLLVQLLAEAGDARSAHALARVALRSDLSGRMTPETRPVWEVAYPNAFRPFIERHTQVAGFEADLLQALMREESALDPKALSWAGALGLTQLMPSTARAVARQLKLRAPSTGALLEPELNIRLGATYLGSLVKRFGGNKPYAIASYNAGAGAVDRWRAQRSELPLDAWVEEIPIAETRGYVKRVLRSFNTYQLLYGGRPAPVGTTAPSTAAGGR